MLVTCLKCTAEFEKTSYAIRKSPHHFCSRSCAASFNNKKSPKRKPEGKCRVCKTPINTSRVWCSGECRGKSRKIARDAYEADSEGRRKRRSQSVVSWRQRVKLKAVASKGGGCQVCGYSKSIRALQFHHLDPSQKDFNIGGKSISWKRIQKELVKCALLCANCHAEVHDEILDVSQLS